MTCSRPLARWPPGLDGAAVPTKLAVSGFPRFLSSITDRLIAAIRPASSASTRGDEQRYHAPLLADVPPRSASPRSRP